MRIAHDNAFTLQHVTSNICMLYDETKGDITTAVIGRIQVRKTKGRTLADLACGSGFDCSDLQFARGHLIGLELGGSDDKYNVVPQFERWQNKGGEWRTMEEHCEKHFNGMLMCVEVSYGRVGGDESHDALVQKFLENPFTPYSHPKVPDRFVISVYDDKTDPKTIANPADFAAKLLALKAAKMVKSWDFNLSDGRLPIVDQRDLAAVQAARIAEKKFAAAAPALTKGYSCAGTFLMAAGVLKDVRSELKTEFTDLDPFVAGGVPAFPVMFKLHGGTEPKYRKKLEEKKKKKVVIDPEVEEQFKRRDEDPKPGSKKPKGDPTA